MEEMVSPEKTADASIVSGQRTVLVHIAVNLDTCSVNAEGTSI